jgi:hypothetical protein
MYVWSMDYQHNQRVLTNCKHILCSLSSLSHARDSGNGDNRLVEFFQREGQYKRVQGLSTNEDSPPVSQFSNFIILDDEWLKDWILCDLPGACVEKRGVLPRTLLIHVDVDHG